MPCTDSNAIDISIGFAAMAISLVYRLPQIYKIYKKKSAADISQTAYLLQDISYVLYIWYGARRQDPIYIASSLLSFAQNIVIHVMKWRFDRQMNQRANMTNIEEPDITLDNLSR